VARRRAQSRLRVVSQFANDVCVSPSQHHKNSRDSLALYGVLTYMSMRELWTKRVRDGELFKLGFMIPGGGPERRTVLLSPEMNKLVCGPWENSDTGARFARLRAELENILAGERLVVCWTPGKGRHNHQIGRLDPPEDNIFDIRSLDPSPGLRVIFHFAEKDVLFTHSCYPRSRSVSWFDSMPLLDRRSKHWSRAIKDSKQNWSMLFPKYDPHH
jgi:hypothetical protein